MPDFLPWQLPSHLTRPFLPVGPSCLLLTLSLLDPCHAFHTRDSQYLHADSHSVECTSHTRVVQLVGNIAWLSAHLVNWSRFLLLALVHIIFSLSQSQGETAQYISTWRSTQPHGEVIITGREGYMMLLPLGWDHSSSSSLPSQDWLTDWFIWQTDWKRYTAAAGHCAPAWPNTWHNQEDL